MARVIAFTLNRKAVQAPAEGELTLLQALRDQLGATGTKPACGAGVCGACTVLVGGRAVRSCITPLSDVAGRAVTTIEGLADGDRLHPLQQAFIDHGAFQCGYCTPGMLMAAHALLAERPDASREQIAAALEDHLCRCGAHPRILAAVEAAGRTLRRKGA